VDFCHPVKTDKDLTAANWEDCIGKDANECPAALCAFDNGVEMIPKNEDYCAPIYMTDDVKSIVRCTESKDAKSCMPEMFVAKTDSSVKPTTAPVCMWRKGAVVAKNDKLDTANKALFESNICHPFITENWDKEAPSCLKLVDQ
jgi:hypothetical protein